MFIGLASIKKVLLLRFLAKPLGGELGGDDAVDELTLL